MTTPAQKSRERSFLELLRRHCPDIAHLEFVDGHEPPDFESGPLGVEIVEFHRGSDGKGSSALAAEKVHTEVRRRAEDEYRGRGGPDVLVSLCFTDRPIPRASRDALAHEIVEAVLASAGAHGASTMVERDMLGPVARLHLHHISVGRFGFMEWDSLQGDWVTGDVEEVGALVRGKEARIPAMRRWSEEVWLLVAAPGTNPVAGRPDLHFASMLTDLSEFRDRTWSSAFDRVYVADVATGRVIRL